VADPPDVRTTLAVVTVGATNPIKRCALLELFQLTAVFATAVSEVPLNVTVGLPQIEYARVCTTRNRLLPLLTVRENVSEVPLPSERAALLKVILTVSL
jgi:hypothetical protein